MELTRKFSVGITFIFIFVFRKLKCVTGIILFHLISTIPFKWHLNFLSSIWFSEKSTIMVASFSFWVISWRPIMKSVERHAASQLERKEEEIYKASKQMNNLQKVCALIKICFKTKQKKKGKNCNIKHHILCTLSFSFSTIF